MLVGSVAAGSDGEEHHDFRSGVVQGFPFDFVVEDGDGDAVLQHAFAAAVRDRDMLADAGGAFLLPVVHGFGEGFDRVDVVLFIQALDQRVEHVFLVGCVDVGEDRIAVQNVVEGEFGQCSSFLLMKICKKPVI